jgi:hypothetical protein
MLWSTHRAHKLFLTTRSRGPAIPSVGWRHGTSGPAVTDDAAPLPPEELERLGLYDPTAADGPERLELIRYALSLGATIEEVAASPNLGELALEMELRPRGPLTLAQAIEAMDIEWPTATRLLGALGMATDFDERITEDEAETIRLFVASIRLLGEETAVQLARVTGAAMAKVAETLVAKFPHSGRAPPPRRRSPLRRRH